MQDSDTLKKFWRILAPAAKRDAALALALMILTSMLEILSIGLVFPLLQVAVDPKRGLNGIPWLASLVDAMDLDSPVRLITAVGVVIFSAFLVKNAILVLVTYIQERIILGLRVSLSSRLFRLYLAAPYVFHLERNSASLLRNITNVIDALALAVFRPIVTTASELLMATTIMGFLLWFSPLVTVLCAATLGITTMFYLRFTKRPLQRYGREAQAENGRLLKLATQTFSGVKMVKAFGRESYFSESYMESCRRFSRLKAISNIMNAIPRGILEVLLMGILVTGLIVIIGRGADLAAVLPMVGTVAVAALRLLPSVNRIAIQVNALQFSREALEIVYRDIQELEQIAPPALAATKQPLQFHDHLEARGLGYQYSTGSGKALDGIDLVVRKGESVAFVGPSGAGKSTMADIFMGILEPTEGQLMADQLPVASDIEAWRLNVGYIPQETFILDDTMARNIAFGVPDADIDRDRVLEVAEMAQLKSVIDQLPAGLDTVLGDRGTRLSGGQRQRVAVARALYRDPQVLILDEATSALDGETEREITAAIDALKGEKTLIIIAHRLSTVRHCDRIVLLIDGRIAATDRFDALVEKSADFRRMVQIASLEREHGL